VENLLIKEIFQESTHIKLNNLDFRLREFLPDFAALIRDKFTKGLQFPQGILFNN